MKFRAKMVDPFAIRQFHNVLVSIAKLSKVCYLRLSKENFYFIADDCKLGGSSVWCELPYESFFSEYVHEGVTNDEPEIYLEVCPGQLSFSLQLLKSSNSSVKCVKVKLTKKHQQPCLTFTIEMTPRNICTQVPDVKQCVQDIPVIPVPRKDWHDIVEPTYEVTDNNFVSLIVTELKRMKHLADRYKNLGTYCRFDAFQNGELEMELLSDRLTLNTHFKHLKVARNRGAVIGSTDAITINIELKRLALFFGANTFGAKRAIVNFVDEKLMHIHFLTEDISLRFYIPSVQI